MPKCKIFDHGLTIGPSGNVRPCCAFLVWNTKSVSFDDDWQTYHHELGKQNEADWLDNCKECKQSEDLGRGSLRTYYNSFIEEDVPGIQYWDLKINNTCNLACRMCDAWSSSKWEQYKDTPGLERRYTNTLPSRWHKEAKDYLPHMLNSKVVKFTGGEPYLIPQVKGIIQGLVDAGVSKNMRLELITNGTQVMESWNHYFEEFSRVDINVSIDAVGKRYEYIRPGSSWELVKENTERFNALKPDHVGIHIACLPMVLNKDHLWEVEAWCQRNGLDYVEAGPIIHPAHLRIHAMEDPKLRKLFIEQMDILDGLHGTDWREFVDE